ncbi:MAG: T9SS C-terminal target domain-containing protein, partial [Riemerella sp.]|nr:T9SS C-terminal target domain-containing protein [Riemerella sp.]
MKRKIFTLGLLSLAFSANAQSLLGVQDQASLHIKEDALIYSGGEVKTVADGVIDNFGNVMIVGGGFKTVTASNTNKTNGGNFILRLWSNATTNGSIVNGGTVIKYGQLYIDNQTTQAQVTGIVDKEYKDNSHGAYQQMAIPFYKKTFASLSSELNANLSGNRSNRTGVLVWNNSKVRFDHFDPVNNNTTDIKLAGHAVANSGATSYYAIGSRYFNAFSGGTLNTLSTNVFTIKGVPFAGNITATLSGAGDGIDFGVGGKNTNYYREQYKSYLGDHWEHSSSPWTGNYGKNIYQFGNPYLTNINLKYIGTIIDNLMGVRVEPSTSVKATGSETGGVYVSYNSAGVAIGDVKQVIVRPMGTFEIKLSRPSVRVLDFGQLRKFAYEANTSNTSTYNGGVTVQSKSSNKEVSLSELSELSTNSTAKTANARLSNSTVKQLGVIALDADGKELGRTYYVV